MRLPRPRFRLLTLMASVALAAIVLGYYELEERSKHYRIQAMVDELLENIYRHPTNVHGWLGDPVMKPDAEMAARFERRRRKHERAAAYPWLAVEP